MRCRKTDAANESSLEFLPCKGFYVHAMARVLLAFLTPIWSRWYLWTNDVSLKLISKIPTEWPLHVVWGETLMTTKPEGPRWSGEEMGIPIAEALEITLTFAKERDQALARLAEAERVLEWYADKENYNGECAPTYDQKSLTNDPDAGHDFGFDYDSGQKAREFLGKATK